uniref:Uncharacterized protein n=1 Tax=Tanacetum cinerariifolium TaxID=118510 RepID=A0A6L2MN14_TANCI|nr:hypothetical protein [Tanacetum cinerariifolium]
MQEFWATVSIHHTSLCFKMNDRSHTLNIENFKDMLQICPRLLDQKFKDPPFEEEILSFIRDLGHTNEIKVLTDVNFNYMHQPWRSVSAIINRCLSGKTTCLDSLCLSLIIDYFMSKDHLISRRNKMFWHTARDDPMFNMIKVISRHQDTHIYGVILPDVFTNQEMLDSKAYKEYYAVASGAEPLKAKTKYKKKADEPVTSTKKKLVQATKGTRLKAKAKVAKPDKKKQPEKKTKAKGLVVLSEVALSKAEQIKLATKGSKKDFQISHASGTGDGVDTQSKVPDEQQQKTSGTDEETGTLPGVPDVPPYKYKSDKESWGDNEGEDDNDDDGDNDENNQTEYEEEDVDERVRTPSDYELTNKEKLDDEETMDDEEDDEVIKELYDYVNVNLGNDDTEMTNADQGFVEVVSLIPKIVDKYLASKMKEVVGVAEQLQTNQLREEAQAENQEFLNQIDKYVTESLGAEVFVRSTNQPQTAYTVAASLSKFELKKILIDKIEANKSINRSDNQKNLYNALVESYNSDKDIITSYGDVVLLKRGRDDQDKDEDPSAGSDRGIKKRKSGKKAESSKDSSLSMQRSQVTLSKTRACNKIKSLSWGTTMNNPLTRRLPDWFKKPERPPTLDPDWSKRRQVNFQPPQTWISQATLAEEPPTSFDEFNDTSFDFSVYVLNRLKIPNLTQEILVGPAFNLLKGTCKCITKLEYHLEERSKATTERLDWHNPENKPDYFINNDMEYLKGGDLSRRYSTSVTKINAATYELKWIEDLVKNYGKYDYSHLKEIEVRRDDQQLYTFKEGDFKRLHLQDIEDMPVEDIHLGVKSYQKKLNLTKPDSFRSNPRNKTAYTSHSDPHGIIYVDRFKRKRLMRTDELHKFSDGTLNDVRTALHDIVAGIRIDYLPMRKWSNLDKKKARVMVQDIDKQLY